MHFTNLFVLVATAATLVASSPIRRQLTAASIIQTISPNSATCADTTECRTAEQVAQPFVDAFQQYGIYEPPVMAAVLALTAFESGDYKYKHNVSPGRPGQGTSNMQMIDFNLKYALSIPALKDQATAIAGSTAGSALSSDDANKILALVTDDKYNFGSGPWFLTTNCADAKSALVANADSGFATYMSCVGVTVTSDRQAYWDRAKTAFSLS